MPQRDGLLVYAPVQRDITHRSTPPVQRGSIAQLGAVTHTLS
ncbi:MAG: hypothetical protein ACREKF_13445 [Candidatus Methylomirabilales bacterium]